ncbi:hypothetical protein HDV06_000671 [Boothiomyces sp. JEL0866]|nr:hypothetical protein HDV06_000671 [Boothiomyces sp. JEL0866]
MFGAILFFSSRVYLLISKNIQMLKHVGNRLDNAPMSSLPESRATIKNETSVGMPADYDKPVHSKQSNFQKKHRSVKKLSDAAAKKILMFILNYFIQWTSVVPYCIGSVFNYYADWAAILCNIGMNCGGILNFIAIYINEGWKDTVEIEGSK